MLKRIFGLLLSAVMVATFMVPVVAAESGSLPNTTQLGMDGKYIYVWGVDKIEELNAVVSNNTITVTYAFEGTTYHETGILSKSEYDTLYFNFSSNDNDFITLSIIPSNNNEYFSMLFKPSINDGGGVDLFLKKSDSTDPTTLPIPNGRYTGTGTAAVDVVFGQWNILTLPLINATITDTNLTLSFRANKIDYLVSAPRVSVASDGTATYHAVEGERTWDISIDPSGALTGRVEYSGGKGVMDFNMALVTK